MAIEWTRHLVTDTPSDVERLDEFLKYFVTVGFADEPHGLQSFTIGTPVLLARVELLR